VTVPASLSISLVISEPWELAPETSSSWPIAQIRTDSAADQGEGERALVEMAEPIAYRGKSFRFLVVRRRDGSSVIADLSRGASIECTFIGQPDDHVDQPDPLDTNRWRGGLAGRATLYPRVVPDHPRT
jgi:hypothetical protein